MSDIPTYWVIPDNYLRQMLTRVAESEVTVDECMAFMRETAFIQDVAGDMDWRNL